jgi:transposase-like protein
MGRKRHAPEQIIRKLREAEVELGRGMKTPEVCRTLGITEQTHYRWRKEYGGLRLDQAKRLKDLEKENARLKKLVADQALDNAILKEVASGNGRATSSSAASGCGSDRIPSGASGSRGPLGSAWPGKAEPPGTLRIPGGSRGR